MPFVGRFRIEGDVLEDDFDFVLDEASVAGVVDVEERSEMIWLMLGSAASEFVGLVLEPADEAMGSVAISVSSVIVVGIGQGGSGGRD